jgi:hypothetical protein
LLLICVHFVFSSHRLMTIIMKTHRSIFRSVALALCASVLIAPRLSAAPAADPADDDSMVVASADCYAIGQQVAAQNGGTLAKANASTQGGQEVCVIVVLVPGKDGQRPRRAEFVVPQN